MPIASNIQCFDILIDQPSANLCYPFQSIEFIHIGYQFERSAKSLCFFSSYSQSRRLSMKIEVNRSSRILHILPSTWWIRRFMMCRQPEGLQIWIRSPVSRFGFIPNFVTSRSRPTSLNAKIPPRIQTSLIATSLTTRNNSPNRQRIRPDLKRISYRNKRTI